MAAVKSPSLILCGVQADVVVLVDKLLHFALGSEVVVVAVVLAIVLHGAVPALHDTVGFGVPGADVDEVVGLDDGASSALQNSLPWSSAMRGLDSGAAGQRGL